MSVQKVILFLSVTVIFSCSSEEGANNSKESINQNLTNYGIENSSKFIPIIGSTGQSNTMYLERNISPYIDANINAPIVFASGVASSTISAIDETIITYNTLDDCMRAGERVGNIWDFANELWKSNWRKEEGLARFALFSSSAGGNLSYGWNPGRIDNYRYKEFVLALNQVIKQTKEIYPGYTPKLHTVIINQGEANTYNMNNLVPWATDWIRFIISVSQDYGNDVVFIIQTLNDQKLFSRQCGIGQVRNSCVNYTKIRQEQLSLVTGSGYLNELEKVVAIDGNILGDSSNSAIHTRDAVHYSLLATSVMGKETYNAFKELNNIN